MTDILDLEGWNVVAKHHDGDAYLIEAEIGVANYDPDYSDRDFPRWPMRLEAQNYHNGFRPALVIEAPDGVNLTCLTRDGDDED